MSSDATNGADDTPPAPMAAENLAEASRQLLEQSFNDGKFELADQLIAADAVNHDPAEPAALRALRGPEVLKRTVSLYRTAFPDVRITVDDVIAAGDKVVLRWHRRARTVASSRAWHRPVCMGR
jgi:SnoaL-like polyketide cyclase